MNTLDINTIAKLVTEAQNRTVLTQDTFIKPPVLYGSEPLTTSEIDTLRLYRKDTKGFASLEETHQYINQFLNGKEHTVNEHELVKALGIIIPTDCLETLEHLRSKNAGICALYSRVSNASRFYLRANESPVNSLQFRTIARNSSAVWRKSAQLRAITLNCA